MKAIRDKAPLLFGLDDVFPLQNLQMVGNIGDVFFKFAGNLTDVFGTAAEDLDDAEAILVGERLEPLSAFLGRERVVFHHKSRPFLLVTSSPSRLTFNIAGEWDME